MTNITTHLTIIQNSIERWILPFLPRLLAALFILGIGLPSVRYLKKKCIRKIPDGDDPTLKRFLINLIYILALIIIIISALTALGVATTSLLTLLGAASLAVGFALKDFLSNIAAGFILIFLRPFKVGDYISVQNNTAGTVTEINLFVTVLNTLNNEALFVPNNQITSNYLINYTYNKLRRLDLNISVDYAADIKQARNILLTTIAAHPYTQADPAPIILVQNLGENAIQLIGRLWVETEQYNQAKYELLEQCKLSLDKANITIPFPQLTVHLLAENKS